MTAPSSLVEEYWLLTTGVQEVTDPPNAVRVGATLTAVRELERAGEVRWVGEGDGLALDPFGDCRCPALRRGWHDALVADVTRVARVDVRPTIPARFVPDPLLRLVWPQTAEHLVDLGAARVSRTWGRNRYGVTDEQALRARREEILGRIGTADAPRDLPPADLDLLVVAWATNSVDALFRVPGVEPADPVVRAIARATAGSPALPRYEAATAFRAPPPPGNAGRFAW